MKHFKKIIFGAIALGLIGLASNTGATNPNVSQNNLDKTVCVHGYTATIRPPTSYTNTLKKKLLAEKHLSGTLADYELDHRISLVLGGNPTSPNNLWMQPYPEARYKDEVESYLARELCAHKITLKEAQDKVVNHWKEIYIQLGSKLGSTQSLDEDDD